MYSLSSALKRLAEGDSVISMAILRAVPASPAERTATGELLQELAKDHTLVVIEHDMAFLRRYATTVTVLHEGKILSEGSVEEVQADPKVREVYLGRSRDERSGAGLAGEPAELVGAGERPALVTPQDQVDATGARRPHPEGGHRQFLTKRATGKPDSKAASETAPASAVDPPSSSVHLPSGRVTVVSPQPSRRPSSTPPRSRTPRVRAPSSVSRPRSTASTCPPSPPTARAW